MLGVVSPTKSDGHVSQDDSAAEEELAVPEEAAPEESVAILDEPEPEPIVEAPVCVPVAESVSITVEDSSEQPSLEEVATEEPATSDVDSSQAAPADLSETQPMEDNHQPTSMMMMTTTNQTQLSSATEESVSASATNASTEDVEMQAVERTAPPPIDEENDNAADVPEEKSTAEEEVSAMEVTESSAAVASEVATNNDENDGDDKSEKNADEASQETTPADDLAKATAAAEAEEAAKKEEDTDSTKKDGSGESRKRKRSRSPSPKRRTRTNSTAANIDDFTCVEDEPEIDADKVTLSWFDSDLQLRISSSTDLCEARPISDAAFGLVWAGARATHGVRVGQKVCYEVLLQQKNARVNFEQEKQLFNLRCGWSTQESDLQLGEAAMSFGFDGEGKKWRGGTAEEYGRAFEVDDVVGVYLVSGGGVFCLLFEKVVLCLNFKGALKVTRRLGFNDV